jgi:hypothetical protein
MESDYSCNFQNVAFVESVAEVLVLLHFGVKEILAIERLYQTKLSVPPWRPLGELGKLDYTILPLKTKPAWLLK